MSILNGTSAGFMFLDDIEMVAKSNMLCDYIGIVGEKYKYDLEHYVERHVCSWGMSQSFVPLCISAVRNDEFWSTFQIKTMQIVLGGLTGISKSVALSVLQILPALYDLIRQKRVSFKETWDIVKDEMLLNSLILALNKGKNTILKGPIKKLTDILVNCNVRRMVMNKVEKAAFIKSIKSLPTDTAKSSIKKAAKLSTKVMKGVSSLGVSVLVGCVVDAVANYLCEQWDRTMSKTLYTNLSSEISLNVVSTSETGVEFIPVLEFIRSSAYLADFVIRNHLIDGEFECMVVSLVNGSIDPLKSEFQVGKTGSCMLDDPYRIDYGKSYVIIVPVGPVVLYKTICCDSATDFFFKYDIASSPALQDKLLTYDTRIGLAKVINPYNVIKLAASAVYMLC